MSLNKNGFLSSAHSNKHSVVVFNVLPRNIRDCQTIPEQKQHIVLYSLSPSVRRLDDKCIISFRRMAILNLEFRSHWLNGS